MTKKLLGLILLLAIVASACGDADSSSETPVETLPPLGSNPTVPDPGGTRPADGVDIFAIADLTVVVSHPDHPDVTYQISCLGDTATIADAPLGVDPELACTSLLDSDVISRLVEGPPVDQACTEIYGGPDVATISGTLGDNPVDAVVDRTNGCGISDWDQTLGHILPVAVGSTE